MDANFTKDGKFIENIKQIKTKRHALATGSKQFSDKDFPTEIGIDALNDFTIHWKRIKELDEEPQLYKDGSPINGEMDQGLIGDNPLVAVISAIANHPKLLNFIFPSGQDFNDPGYCGLFYFRFWKMGKWVYVVVDDKIPIVGNKKADEPRKKDKSKGRDLQAADSSKVINEMKKDEKEEEKPLQQGNEKEGEKSAETKKESKKSSIVQLPPLIEGEGKLSDNEKPSVNPEPAKDEVKPNNPVSIQPPATSDAKSSTAKPIDEAKKSGIAAAAESPKNMDEPDTKAVNAEHGTIKASNSSEVTSKAKTSNVKPENQKLSDQPEHKTNGLSEHPKTAESLELKHSTSKRTSESIGKPSVVSKGSFKNKDGVGDIDPEKSSNRNNSTIFVRVFGSDGKLYYWATLLEKAYAKAYGGYSQLPKISITETLLDLTGGVTEIFYTSHLPKGFFLDFKNYSDTRAIMLAATNLPMKQQEEQAEPKDDPQTNLFAVTSVILADFRKSLGRDKIVGFVRLSNPFGEVKWMDPWAETCQEWQVLPQLVTTKLQMNSRRCGEFYLTYQNFLRAFSALVICTLPDGENFNSEGYFGEWTKPKLQYNLCRIDDLRFHEFPQHKIWARDPNAKDTETDVIISLVQNGRCCCSESPSYNAMQLFLFCMAMDRTHTLPLNFEFFRYNRPIGCSNVSFGKEVTARFKILQGHYLVVPVIDYSTIVHPCQANDYVLRVITPAKFPKPPPPPLSTFTDSENLNIYFDLAETIEEPKIVVTVDSKESNKSETDKAGHKEKGKGKKKKVKH